MEGAKAQDARNRERLGAGRTGRFDPLPLRHGAGGADEARPTRLSADGAVRGVPRWRFASMSVERWTSSPAETETRKVRAVGRSGAVRVCETRRVPLRAAAICGLLAPVTFVAGLVLGDLAQPDAFSPANDNISDVGAQTADQAWLYNQIAANLNGLLIVAFALGLWRALGSGWLARLGVLGLAILGVTRFLEGFLRLDCRGMDDVCENTSLQADAHGIESGIASALFFLVPPLLAFAFRRLPEWRDLWLPTLLAVPVVIAASVLFSIIGNGAAVRAASITWFLWLGLIAWRLLRLADSNVAAPIAEASAP